jgi:tetratricopeptide (TPR) repeat protein
MNSEDNQSTENEETAERDPDGVDYFNLGLEMYNSGEPYDKVIETFEMGLQESSRDSSFYTCLSWLHLLRNKGNDRKKAIDLSKSALKFDPTNAQAQYNLVLAYMLTGRKGVREEFEKAISMSKDQDLEAAKTNLKEALDREGSIPEVEKLLKWIEQA